MKSGTHSSLFKESHTTAHTAKRGPSLPRPQHGLVPSAKFLLVLHAFIYIHFPVHCEPSTPAEEKNLSKLPPQTLSQTIFHRVFQLLAQMAHVRFHRRKWVHTRLSEKNRTQGLTRRNRERFGWGAIITLDTSCTFTNIPGPGVRTANFAPFGSWSGGALEERREPAEQRCAYACRCPEGVAAPLGCVIFFRFCRNYGFHTLCSGLSACARHRRYHYPRRALRASETLDGRLSKRLTCRFLRSGSLH